MSIMLSKSLILLMKWMTSIYNLTLISQALRMDGIFKCFQVLYLNKLHPQFLELPFPFFTQVFSIPSGKKPRFHSNTLENLIYRVGSS